MEIRDWTLEDADRSEAQCIADGASPCSSLIFLSLGLVASLGFEFIRQCEILDRKLVVVCTLGSEN